MKKYLAIVFVFIFCLSTTTALAYKPGTLYIGSSGESVKAMQQQLATLGFTISTDGKFGKKTKEILVSFQAQYGLVADGIAGSKTLAAIYSSSSNSPMVATEQSKPIIKSEGKCATDFSSKLSLPDQAIFSLALNKQIGQCTIADHRGLSSYCDYYVNSAAVGKLGATGYPKNPESGDSTGCVVAPTLEKGVNSCWGGYNKETMCTNDYVKNAANQIRQAIRDNACGCGEITKPVTPPVVAQPETPKTLTAWEKVCSDGEPHVQVISPNGGEEYVAGQNMSVKWKSCNAPLSAKAIVLLESSVGVIPYLTSDVNVPSILSFNDGVETFTIPTSVYSGLVSGNYKARVTLTQVVASDESDKWFAIKKPDQETTSSTGLCLPGMGKNSWNILKILSPNGDETYNFGERVLIKWASCADQRPDSTVRLTIGNSIVGDSVVLIDSTPDDGSEWVNLPQRKNGWSDGSYYKVGVGFASSGDASDSPFSLVTGIIKPKENTVTSDY